MGRTERLAQPKKFGKYELVARLAPGTMGDVYKAKSHGLEGFEKILCVKIINPALAQNSDFIETLIAEAQRIVALAHANIAQVYDLGQEEDSGQYYIAGEYVAGFDLKRSLELRRMTNQPQPTELSVFIVSEVAKGLDYAHRRKDYNFNNLNLVHGHLCPTNILLSFDGEVKITDFGVSLAREYTPDLDDQDVIRRFLYAAPEVASGGRPTQVSDVFSLGLLLYEMLAGEHPYFSSDPEEVQRRARSAQITPITEVTDIPRQLAAIVDSMLVPDPAGRAATAGGVYEDLVAFIFGNNLRADTRALAFAMQELRRDEVRLAPEETTQEVGMEEISLADLRVLEEVSDPSVELESISDMTNAELPSHKLQSQYLGDDRPGLPGALEEYYNSTRAGGGKAVLVDGPLGAGRHYLPDRLADALGWRGNTRAFSVQATPDDSYVPFGAMTTILLEAMQTPNEPLKALEHLAERGVDDSMLDAFRSVLGIEPSVAQGKTVKRRLLAQLSLEVLREATQAGPLVVAIDRVERLDQLTLEILRDIIGHIGDMSLMLVLCTSSAEMMRAAFDIGRPEALEALRVVGDEPPNPDDIADLTVQAAILLALVGLSGHPMTQADLAKITGLGHEQVSGGLKELSEHGLIRIPEAGVVIAGVDDLPLWVHRSFTKTEIEQWASSLSRYYSQRALQSPTPGVWSPLLSRLHAYAGNRRQTLSEAHRYAAWLEREGWIHAALDFYHHAASLVSENRLGSPHARIGFLLSRAELALELSLVDICRATLQPVTALSEAARNDRGAIRAQLLLGQMALQQDDLVEAFHHFRRAADAGRSVNDPDLLAFSFLGLARWHDRYGDPLAAQRMIEGAMNLYNRWGTFRMDLNTRALMLNRAVRMFSRRGLGRRASLLYDDLRVLAERSHLPLVQCRADWAEAAMSVAEEDYAMARTALLRADSRAEEHGLVALRLELLRERAVAALSDEDYEDVVSLSDQLHALAVQHQDLYSQQRATDLRATAACVLRQDTDESLRHLEVSLARANQRNVPKDVYRCHLNLDRALRSMGKTARAEEHRRKAETMASRLRYHV
jgi:serine/threonine protein kinase